MPTSDKAMLTALELTVSSLLRRLSTLPGGWEVANHIRQDVTTMVKELDQDGRSRGVEEAAALLTGVG